MIQINAPSLGRVEKYLFSVCGLCLAEVGGELNKQEA